MTCLMLKGSHTVAKLNRKQKGLGPKWETLGRWCRPCQAKNLEVGDLIEAEDFMAGFITKIEKDKTHDLLTFTLDCGEGSTERIWKKPNSRPLVFLGPRDLRWATLSLGFMIYGFHPAKNAIEDGLGEIEEGDFDPAYELLTSLNRRGLSVVQKKLVKNIEGTLQSVRPYLLATKCSDTMSDLFKVGDVREMFYTLSYLLSQVKDQTLE